MRDIRGKDVSMIFQEPMTSLNPVLTIGRQLGETLRLHAQPHPPPRADKRAAEMLDLNGILDPRRPASTIRTASRAACASAR